LTNSELEKSLRRLESGDNPEDVLKQFAHILSQKFLHQPTTEINEADNSQIIDAARKLFGLDNNDKKH